MRAPHTTSSTETIQDQLAGLAPEAALFVRDLVRGLEAEAGTARALSTRADLRAARAEDRRDKAEARERAMEAERAAAVAAAQALEAECDALRARVHHLEVEATRSPGRGRR